MAIPYEEDVERTLTGIMAKNSPLMKQARTEGLQSAQNVGLGQSTKAIQASQAAAYNVALPMASQQAQQEFQKGTQAREHTQQTALQASEQAHQRSQLQLGAYEERVSAEQRAYLDRLNLEAGAYWTRVNADWQYNLDKNLRALDNASQERIAAMQVNAANKERAVMSAAAFENNYSSSLNAIMANPEIPAYMRQGMLDHLQNIRTQNWNAVTALYRQEVPW